VTMAQDNNPFFINPPLGPALEPRGT